MAAHGLIGTWRAVKAPTHRRASPPAVRNVIKPMRASTCVSHFTQQGRQLGYRVKWRQLAAVNADGKADVVGFGYGGVHVSQSEFIPI